MTDKIEGVQLHGFDNTEPLDWMDDEFTFSHGKNLKDLRWKRATMAFSKFIRLNIEHKVGQKDGSSFMQGSLASDGIQRKKQAVDELNLLALDIDHGLPIPDMIKAVEKQGLFAMIYTSHSHNKNTTNIKLDTIRKKTGKAPSYEFSEDEICDYLTNQLGFHSSIIEGGVTVKEEHNDSGPSLVVMHNPMPRYRVVFILMDPFFPAKQEDCTHQEGMQVWARKYAGVAQMLNTRFDAACTDVSRLYYQARHAKGSDFETHLIYGDTLDLMAVEDGNPKGFTPEIKTGNATLDKLTAAHNADEGSGSDLDNLKFPWLVEFLAIHNKSFQTYDFFKAYCEERGEHIDGKGAFKCPHDEDHSDADNPEDAGFYAANPGCDESSSGEGGPAICMHGSCKGSGRDRIHYIDRTLDDLGLEEENLREFVSGLEGGETVENLEDLLDEDIEVGDFTDAIGDIGVNKKDFANMKEDMQEFVTRISLMPKMDDDALQGMLVLLAERLASTTMEQAHLKQISKRGGYNMVTLKKEYKVIKQEHAKKNESVRDAQKNKEYPKKALKRLRQMNKQMATILRGSTGFIMKDQAYRDNPAHEGIKYINMTSSATLQRNESMIAIDRNKEEVVSQYAYDVWMKWPERRHYDAITFEPSVEGHIMDKYGDEKYNLWNGWAFNPRKAGRCDILLEHIYENICHSTDEWYNFFMTYFAHLIQKPEQIPGVAVVIQGEKGCGKSIVLEEILVNNLVSPYGMTTATIKELFGTFNARVENKLLIVMTEAFWGGDKAVEGMLKDAITGSNMVLKLKGIDDCDLPNYRRFACTANDGFVVPATHDERRFFVLKCLSDRIGDVEYFQAMMDEMEDGGYEHLMHILSTWPEPKQGWKGYFFKPPVTPWLQEQISENKNSWEKWIDNLIYEGEALAPSNSDLTDIRLSETEPTYVKQVDMNAWWRYNTRNNQHQSPAKKCTAYMSKTFPDVEVERMRVHKTDPAAVPCYKFPPRKELRITYPEIFREVYPTN